MRKRQYETCSLASQPLRGGIGIRRVSAGITSVISQGDRSHPERSSTILLGQVTRPTLKTDAERVVKAVEGVEQVDNQIEVLPASPMDDQLRIQLYHAIYGYAPLEKYAMGVQRPIRIVVKMGHVTLEGVVDSDADKNMANIRANTVPGIFSVTNNLQVGGNSTS